MKNTARHRIKNIIFYPIFIITAATGGIAYAEQSPPPGPDSSLSQDAPPDPAPDQAPEPPAEEQFWSKFKGIPIGPFRLDLGAGLRLRGEFQDNQNIKKYGGGTQDSILLERTRLELGVHFLDNFRLFVQGQDAHELGCDFSNKDFPNGSPYNNHFDLRQAFLEWIRIGGTPAGFKVGRQSIAFTDTRLMGPGEWGNVGRYTWDAAALTWRSKLAEGDLFYAFRVQNDPISFDNDHYDYDVLGFFSTFPVRKLKLHLFYFLQMNNFPDDNQSGSGSHHRHSLGFSGEGKFDPGLDSSLGIIPQFGRWGESAVQALGGYAVLGYTAPLPWSPRIGLHYVYASGDSDPANGTIKTFDGVFGAVDQYYGRMNLFAWMNLHNPQIALSASPIKFLKVNADYHLFFLADGHDAWYYANGKSQRQDPNGESGNVVGQEIDIVAVVKATRLTEFQVGYGLFAPGEFVRNTGTHDLAHWGFLQGEYSF
jgi:hypothetical protein